MTKEYAASIGADQYAKDAMDTVRYADEINLSFINQPLFKVENLLDILNDHIFSKCLTKAPLSYIIFRLTKCSAATMRQ